LPQTLSALPSGIVDTVPENYNRYIFEKVAVNLLALPSGIMDTVSEHCNRDICEKVATNFLSSSKRQHEQGLTAIF